MNSRIYKHILPFILASSLLGLIFSGCGNKPAANPTSMVSPSATPSDNFTEAQNVGIKLAEEFIKNSSTFKFDGIEGSIKFIEEQPSPISSFRAGVFIFEYQTGHPGHGDRTGQVLAEVITTHNAAITVNLEKDAIVTAICDNTWDMISQKDMPTTLQGVVISGGDTTPPGGPLDAHRVFVYKVLTDEGYFINVSYTAYPPSPAGDAARSKITLDFYNGQILVGNEMIARGTLDRQSNTIVVAGAG